MIPASTHRIASLISIEEIEGETKEGFHRIVNDSISSRAGTCNSERSEKELL